MVVAVAVFMVMIVMMMAMVVIVVMMVAVLVVVALRLGGQIFQTLHFLVGSAAFTHFRPPLPGFSEQSFVDC